MMIRARSILWWVAACAVPAWGQVNYDEAKVPRYTLPDPLVARDGTPIKSRQQWEKIRRPEILELFTEEMYGRAPGKPAGMTFQVRSVDRHALQDKSIRKQVTVYFSDDRQGPQMDILIHLPKDRDRPVPLFVGLNFGGNQATDPDPGIRMPTGWMRDKPAAGYRDHRATEATRGSASSRWPFAQVLARGYGMATIYYGDIDPDFDDGFQNGVQPLSYKPGQTRPNRDQWGSIAAWAWGLSRVLDYFETDADIDQTKVAVLGHSRLGKTALWAGATDGRFALVISNNSGCGGAALSRRRFGETVQRINTSFPHWFCGNFKKYNGHEDRLPIDQHELIALIAPRPVLVSSAQGDRWADPRGEFLSVVNASPVYRLLGTEGCTATRMPPPNRPALSIAGYNLRPGKHDLTSRDWKVFCDFADRHL